MTMDALRSMAAQAATVFLILLFVRAAWHKIGDYGRFAGFLADYRLLPAALVDSAARALIAAELGCVALLAWPASGSAGALAAAGLLLLYAVAIAVSLARGQRRIDCGCGGAPQHLSWALVARNLALAALAVPAAAGGPLDLYAGAVAVLAGLLLWGAYLLVEQVIANADRRLQLLAARQAQSSR